MISRPSCCRPPFKLQQAPTGSLALQPYSSAATIQQSCRQQPARSLQLQPASGTCRPPLHKHVGLQNHALLAQLHKADLVSLSMPAFLSALLPMSAMPTF